MLELVVGQVSIGLPVVALCDEVEERLVLLVMGERLLDDLPADRGPVLGRRERVAEPRAAGPHAPEGTQLLAPVRVAEAQAVTGRLGDDAGGLALLDRIHEPVAAVQCHQCPGLGARWRGRAVARARSLRRSR